MESSNDSKAIGWRKAVANQPKTPWWDWIRDGKKKYEARINRNDWRKIDVGDIVELYVRETPAGAKPSRAGFTPAGAKPCLWLPSREGFTPAGAKPCLWLPSREGLTGQAFRVRIITIIDCLSSFGEAFDLFGENLVPIPGITREEVEELYRQIYPSSEDQENLQKYGVVVLELELMEK